MKLLAILMKMTSSKRRWRSSEYVGKQDYGETWDVDWQALCLVNLVNCYLEYSPLSVIYICSYKRNTRAFDTLF